MFIFKSTYFCSFVDSSQAEFLFFGLKEIFEKQNDEISMLRNKLDTKPVDNSGMLLFC